MKPILVIYSNVDPEIMESIKKSNPFNNEYYTVFMPANNGNERIELLKKGKNTKLATKYIERLLKKLEIK